MKKSWIILLFAFAFSNTAWGQNPQVTPAFLLAKIQNDPAIMALVQSLQYADPRSDLDPELRRGKQTILCNEIKLTTEMSDGLMLFPFNRYWVGFMIQCFDQNETQGRKLRTTNLCGGYVYSEYTDHGYPIELTAQQGCKEVSVQ